MPRPRADAREAELLQDAANLTSDRSPPKRSHTTRFRSTQRQHTTRLPAHLHPRRTAAKVILPEVPPKLDHSKARRCVICN